MIDSLMRLHDQALEEYARDRDATKALADSPEQAALVLVCHALLNLDLALNR